MREGNEPASETEKKPQQKTQQKVVPWKLSDRNQDGKSDQSKDEV